MNELQLELRCFTWEKKSAFLSSMNEKLEVVATAAQIRFSLSSNYLELGSSCFPPTCSSFSLAGHFWFTTVLLHSVSHDCLAGAGMSSVFREDASPGGCAASILRWLLDGRGSVGAPCRVFRLSRGKSLCIPPALFPSHLSSARMRGRKRH